MNKPIFALSVLSAFLAGVLVGPWLQPQPQPVPVPVPAPPAPPPVEPKPVPQPPPPAAPVSELQLKGVFVGADASRSRALIAYGDSSPKSYRLDEKLPDGSTLKAVGNKSVEVEKDGQTRTLLLTRSSNPSAELEALTPEEAVPAPPPESSAVPTPSPGELPGASPTAAPPAAPTELEAADQPP